jgi:hypothetical protein
VKRMPTRVEGSFGEADTHQRSGQSPVIAPTSPRLGCAEGRSPFAESARVSLDSSFYPPRAGAKGLIGNAWHSLCRYFWIPASTEMAGQVQDRCRTGAAGCCRGLGCTQILYSPPQEWGIKGVEKRTTSTGFPPARE